jgi:hypothetical protein
LGDRLYEVQRLTTNTKPNPFSTVHLTLHPSFSNPSSGSADLFSIMMSLTSVLTGERAEDWDMASKDGL